MGGGKGNPAFEDEIAALHAAGILVEASAGNRGPACATLHAPGEYDQVLTTGSVNHAGGILPGTLSTFSSRGPSDLYPEVFIPDIMAPGENVRSSIPGGGYEGGWSGTSMAGPHTVGLVGLIWSANPALRGWIPETVQIILETAVPLTDQNGSSCGGNYSVGPNHDWGHGTIDALAAVNEALNFGDSGILAGTVTATGSGDPIGGALIRARLSPALTWQTVTNPIGQYERGVLSGIYLVAAHAYGYETVIENDVVVLSDSTTIQNFELPIADTYTVSGTVTDGTTGWPLYAHITVEGDPFDPPAPANEVWTNPVTGFYSFTLPGSITYTLVTEAFVAGYQIAEKMFGPLSGDSTENINLNVDNDSCEAPGYQSSTPGICNPSPGGLVVGNIYDGNTSDPVIGAQVVNQASYSTTAMRTGDDPRVDDAFYTLFSPTGSQIFSATLGSIYTPDIEMVTVVQSDTVKHDFVLDAGWLTTTPQELTLTLVQGFSGTLPLTITNIGTYTASFEIFEYDLGMEPSLVDQALVPAPPGWTEAAPVPHPTAFYGFAQCADDPDSFYVLGGAYAASSPLAYVRRYDADTDTWQSLASLPTALLGNAATCYEGKIYTAGGGSGKGRTNLFYIYDIASNSWSIGSALPRAVAGAVLGAWDGKIYLIGGEESGYIAVNQVDIYDIAMGLWSPDAGAQMPVPVNYPGWVQAGPYIYMAGGSDSTAEQTDTTQRYNMASDTWELGPALPSPLWASSLAITTNYLYSIGGSTAGLLGVTPQVLRLKHTIWPGGGWTDTGDPLPQGLIGNSAGFCTEAISGGEIWSVGGGDSSLSVINTNQYRAGEPCSGPSDDVSWLSAEPLTGEINAGENLPVNVTFDAASSIPDRGFHHARLQVSSQTPYADPFIPVTLEVLGYDVEVAPESAASSALPGATVTYTLQVTNIGDFVDSYDVSVAALWNTSVTETVGSLDPGTSSALTITVDIPPGSMAGESDTAVITLTSQGNGVASDSSELTTSVAEAPVADFTSNSSVVLGETTLFTNNTTGTEPITYLWDFGDNTTSTLENPTHTYTETDTYTVTLTATNTFGADTARATVTVGEAPEAGFTSNSPVLLGEMAVFTNTTTGTEPIEYLWDFGDNLTSTLANLTHMYTETGGYTVTLTASNAFGVDSATATVTVGEAPEAGFISNGPVLLGEMAVFTNTTTGTEPIEYLWDFGDNLTSTLVNPTHIYTETGSYTVTLTASNAFGSSQVSGVFVVEEAVTEVYIYLPLIPRLADE